VSRVLRFVGVFVAIALLVAGRAAADRARDLRS
jgi:hypothetical protein